MSLVSLPEELYCQVIKRLHHDDEALGGFDERTARYGEGLREKYRRYSQEVYDGLPLRLETIFIELTRARARERAFRGVQVDIEEFNTHILGQLPHQWIIEASGRAIYNLIRDPNLTMRWEGFELHVDPHEELSYSFGTPAQNVLLWRCFYKGTNVIGGSRDVHTIECQVDEFTGEQQAIEQLHRAFTNEHTYVGGAPHGVLASRLGFLFRASSLFSRSTRHWVCLYPTAGDKDIADRLEAMSDEVVTRERFKREFVIDFEIHRDALHICEQIGHTSIEFYEYYNYRLR